MLINNTAEANEFYEFFLSPTDNGYALTACCRECGGEVIDIDCPKGKEMIDRLNKHLGDCKVTEDINML